MKLKSYLNIYNNRTLYFDVPHLQRSSIIRDGSRGALVGFNPYIYVKLHKTAKKLAIEINFAFNYDHVKIVLC